MVLQVLEVHGALETLVLVALEHLVVLSGPMGPEIQAILDFQGILQEVLLVRADPCFLAVLGVRDFRYDLGGHLPP